MLTKNKSGIIVTTGLALFAMFFGAGNMVFPIALGATAGQHIFVAWIAFIISGVGIPFLGLFAASLFEGDYWAFFRPLGKPLSLIVITFIILIIGPLFAAPRTEDITFGTLEFLLPKVIVNKDFSLCYFAVVFLLSYRHRIIIDIIGRILSPLKLTAFITLIIASLITIHPLLHIQTPGTHVALNALSVGYGTMDLLAAIFFCHVAYRSVERKCKAQNITDKKILMNIILKASVMGAVLIGLIYTGFMVSAAFHANALQDAPTASMISRLARTVLADDASLFVAFCVTLACLATATALTVISTDFFKRTLFQNKVPRLVCLLLMLTCMYEMSILGFNQIMRIAIPILNVLYPSLIVICIFNIYRKIK